jgi:uncharacterized membrane protein
MDDLEDRLFYWMSDEATVSLLLFIVVALLGGASLVLFLVSSQRSATRLEFVLLVSALVVMFYMTLRNSTF